MPMDWDWDWDRSPRLGAVVHVLLFIVISIAGNMLACKKPPVAHVVKPGGHRRAMKSLP